MGHRHDNEARTLQRARRGYALAMADAAYRERVLARLDSSSPPTDLWAAIDWTWSVVLGGARPEGPLAAVIVAGADVLVALLRGDESARALWASETHDALSLNSTLSSHPFAEQTAWLLRKTSRAS